MLKNMFTALEEQAAWAIWVCFAVCRGLYKVIHSHIARLEEEVVGGDDWGQKM
jgi:hypothetical protein